MRHRAFLKFSVRAIATLTSILFLLASQSVDATRSADGNKAAVTQGTLQAVNASGELIGQCPLKHTTVKAEISGFISRVTVTQEFINSFQENLEAVYTFPLPQNAAVDDMTMLVGGRTVKGQIMRREEAQAAYAAAKNRGQVASLLDQERPNIFTQSVANIMPGEQVTVTISYVETLEYEDGTYEFTFPMVVGERYMPGGSDEAQSNHAGGDVPDAARLNPPTLPAGFRAGHDISIEIALDAGVPLDALSSATHEVEVERPDEHRAVVRLKDQATIPNQDFVFKYDVAGRRIEDALLAHRTEDEGFFTFILQPPDRVTVADVTPKELVFVLDTSGSMQGYPIEKAKETVNLALDHLYPQDTFNLITFSGDTHVLFDEPVPATPENLKKAKNFLESRKSDGGTEMMKAIKAALEPSDAQGHLRIACFMTDGQVGNDMEIIAKVQKHRNARVFAIGFGSSPNRFLLDKMAEYGRGEVEYVSETDDDSKAAERFFERVRDPLLTDISVEWEGVKVTDIYPKTIPDLFGAKPVILSGRYGSGGVGLIHLKGKMSGRDFVREIPVNLPQADARHDVLAPLWARRRIDDLMGQDMGGMQMGQMNKELREAITTLGLQYKLMTQFTSFVAIEDRVATNDGNPRRVDVPAEAPANAIGLSSSNGTANSSHVGGVYETVTVTAASNAMVNVDSAQLSSAVTTRSITNLPLNGRSMLPLLHLAPGVAPPPNQLSNPTPAQITVNGQRPGSNNFILDGVIVDDGTVPLRSGASPALTAAGSTSALNSIEATQEINIRTYNFPAEQGRVPGAQISIVTRAGTNEFHGSVFEYFGTGALAANDWFANSRGLARPAHGQNIFGGTFGGPIRRDRSFFFFAYEGLRQHQPLTAITAVPSFEARLAAPATLQPFLNAFPLPTGGRRGDNFAEAAASYATRSRHDALSVRVDERITDRLDLRGRYSFVPSEALERGGGLFSLNTVNLLQGRNHNLMASASFVNSSTMVTDVRFTFAGARLSSESSLDNFGGATLPTLANQAVFSLLNQNGSAVFDLNGRNAALKSAAALADTQRHLDVTGSVSLIHGGHSFKFGGDWERIFPVLGSDTEERNVFFNGLAPVLAGTASRVNLYSHAGTQRPVFNFVSLYGQDEWRLTPRLMLSYGLRWELAPAPSGGDGPDAFAVTGTDDPSQLRLAARGTPLWKTTYGNFAPRVAVIYQVLNKGGVEMVLRGGLGLLYDLRNEAASYVFTDSFPFTAGQTFFDVPFSVASSPAASAASPVGVPFVAFDPHLKLPYTWQWFGSLETAFGSDQKVTAAYVGSAGRRLLLTRTLIDPNPDFSFVRLINNGARSDYSSLQLQYERRMSRGLQALASYTLARSEDDVAGDSIYRAVLLSDDRRLDRAPSDFDVRHQLTGSLSYDIPALFDSGLGNSLLRHWGISSVLYARSARPLNVVYAIPTTAGLASLRPDVLTNVPLFLEDAGAAGGRRLNAAAFSLPALERQGTLARNALRGFPFYQVNALLSRTFHLTDEIGLQFKAEAFNLLNHPNFEDPLGNDLSLGTRWAGGAFVPNTAFGQSFSLSGKSLWTGAGRGFNSAYGTGGARSFRFAIKFQF